MTEHQKPTLLEKVSGSLVVESAMTLIAAHVGVPIAALLPVMTNALANGRHHARVEEAITQINATLEAHADKLRHLSDEQYKLVNETILAIFQTLDAQKLEYLQRIVRNGLDQPDLVSQEAAALSRIVRDISADELRFLIDHANTNRIQIADNVTAPPDVLVVSPDSTDGLAALGLISLGVLMPGQPTWDDSDSYRFSSLKNKLLSLVRETTNATSA